MFRWFLDRNGGPSYVLGQVTGGGAAVAVLDPSTFKEMGMWVSDVLIPNLVLMAVSFFEVVKEAAS